MNELVLRPLPDGRSFKLDKTYKRVVRTDSWVVPHGFITDFASVPRFLWRIWPPWGKYGPASVIHDYMYRNPIICISRKDADKAMLFLMKEDGVSLVSRYCIYFGVRIGGWAAWNPRLSLKN